MSIFVDSVLSNVSKANLEAFLKENYHPSQMTLSAVGVSHKEVVAAVEGMLGGDSPKAALAGPSKSAFVGGDSRTFANGDTAVALAWEADSSAEYKVIAKLLGDDSFLKAYRTSCLIGFQTTSSDPSSFVKNAAASFKGAANVSPAALASAKLQAKMAILGPLDSKKGALELIISGANLESSLAAIDAVSVDSVKAAVKKSLAGGGS
jgi:predicted Zn-dependent peptidase